MTKTPTPSPKDEAIVARQPVPNLPYSALFQYRLAEHYGEEAVFYPENDGKPIADNMIQARWMRLLFSNLELMYAENPDVLVCTDLLWYPVKGDPKTNTAPDVMVIFGRKKYERGSYKQFDENGIPPQVVFEILSDSNKRDEMLAKTDFYRRYGVQEFYLYDPTLGGFEVLLLGGSEIQVVSVEYEWTSPLLGVRFVPQARAPMEIYFPDGKPFRSHCEVHDLMEFRTQERDAARERATLERERAEAEAKRASDAEAEIVRLRALLGDTKNGDI